jgi:DNA-binding CsgD family transcriptional regulator
MSPVTRFGPLELQRRRREENLAMSVSNSEPGFLLINDKCHPLATNEHAVQILTFPNRSDKIKHLPLFLCDRIRMGLVNQQSKNLEFVREYQSGRRRYVCRAFRLDSDSDSHPVAIVLDRTSSSITTASELVAQFDLTPREQETVQLLLQGLTSKEIGSRMHISPNTVKAFLRLVMVKMGVSTRSGIVGRVVRSVESNRGERSADVAVAEN